MRITKLILENIRSHKRSEIEVNKGITVFTGRTGSGKSSILMSIEYALFGSEGGVSNNAILRRNSPKGCVLLEFEEGGNVYTIRRGLKRSGSTITTDISNMSILANGEPLPLLGRATDLNNKILEILNYPDDVQPKDLFEITSYTRQDEIRALIEMSGEKRQEHIDRILQLSKYKSTWENMKDVISTFELEMKEMQIRLENIEELRKDVVKIEKRILENESLVKKDSEVLLSLSSKYSAAHKEKTTLEEEIKNMLEKRRQLDKTKGNISGLESDTHLYETELTALKMRDNELKEHLASLGEIRNFEELQMKNMALLTDIERFEKEIERNNREFEKMKKLGVGNCPTCKQKITSAHLSHLEKEFDKIIDEFKVKAAEAEREQSKLEPLIRSSKKALELTENLKRIEDNINEKSGTLKNKKKLLATAKEEEQRMEKGVHDISSKEEKLKELSLKEKELFSKVNSLTEIIKLKKKELEEFKSEHSEKEKTVLELEKSRKNIQLLEKTINVLARMREDIRNIREIIRKNFLEDFRQEFQKKFEEIRRYEEEYTVDIKTDYEPVAYTQNGEEVPIANLSGGEKTSVALAYRLALADLAAQVSEINPSEILILDEPTTGFDQEDIKALPQALRNIQTIPQIIIVTHEEELKNAADYKYQITKQGNESTINRAD